MSADGILTVSVVGWDIDPKFLARVQITSLPAAQPVGMGRWRIAIGPTVTRVEITLTVRNADLSKPLESLEQVFGVETSNNIRTLRPVLCYNHGDGWSPGSPPVATDPIWHRRLHPRLHWSADSAHEFPGLVIDFAFVVVTAYLKGISSLEYVYNHAADPNDPHHGCQLHALEFTNKSGPKTWLVCVPPSLDTSLTNVLRRDNWKRGVPKERAQSSVDALVYLRSRVTRNDQLHTYTKIEETSIAPMARFFAEPPANAPFFAQPDGKWDSFPNIGFERQLVRSGKSLLLIKPWPSGLDYGSLLSSGTLRPILNHLMICLAGNGLVAKDSLSGPRCGRIGLAGFSGGGNEAIKVWRVNRGQIDELYLFDPQSFRLDQNNPKNSVWLFFDANGKIAGDLLEWFRDDNKYLRLIGGLQHEDALLIADNLLPKWRSLLDDYEAGRGNKPPRVWVKPSTFAYRTGIGDGETYAYAMLFNSKSPGALPDLSQCRLTPPGSPASALTQAT
jgi:hypothetical protein